MASLEKVEGIGPKYAVKLKAAGIKSTDALLKACATPKGRKEVAANSGITETLILKWANHVDLFRIKGVGEEYADLLEASGVDTVPELSQRKAENLLPKMVEVNNKKKLVRQTPTAKQVEDWVKQAKKLPRVLKY